MLCSKVALIILNCFIILIYKLKSNCFIKNIKIFIKKKDLNAKSYI